MPIQTCNSRPREDERARYTISIDHVLHVGLTAPKAEKRILRRLSLCDLYSINGCRLLHTGSNCGLLA